MSREWEEVVEKWPAIWRRPRINTCLGIRSRSATALPLWQASSGTCRSTTTLARPGSPNFLLNITTGSYSIHSSTMGWLPWSSGDSNKASDGGRIAPDRSSRARCWEGRDMFFSCLDRNDILDGIKDDKEARRKCAKEVAEFEAACSQTWVCSGPS